LTSVESVTTTKIWLLIFFTIFLIIIVCNYSYISVRMQYICTNQVTTSEQWHAYNSSQTVNDINWWTAWCFWMVSLWCGKVFQRHWLCWAGRNISGGGKYFLLSCSYAYSGLRINTVLILCYYLINTLLLNCIW